MSRTLEAKRSVEMVSSVCAASGHTLAIRTCTKQINMTQNKHIIHISYIYIHVLSSSYICIICLDIFSCTADTKLMHATLSYVAPKVFVTGAIVQAVTEACTTSLLLRCDSKLVQCEL